MNIKVQEWMQEAKHSPKLVISLKGYLSLCASLSHSHPIYHRYQHVLSTAQTDHSKAYPSHSKAITKGLNNFSLCSTCKVKNKNLTKNFESNWNQQTWIAPESSLRVRNASFPKALRATILPAIDTWSLSPFDSSPFAKYLYISCRWLAVWVLSQLYA